MSLLRISACCIAIAAALLPAPRGWAKGAASSPSAAEIGGGIVLDQTITPAGQDFFQLFVSSWRDRPLSERFAISVHERPSARRGTQVWIEFARRRIFQAALPPGRAAIRSLSERAVAVTSERVADVEVERLLFRDPDIGADEI